MTGPKMLSFVSRNSANKVVFGTGTFGRLAEEIRQLGAQRPLIIASSGRAHLARRAAAGFGEALAGIHGHALTDVPVEAVHNARMEAVRRRADCYVAIGGGSAIGLAKALTLREGMRIVAVPTTYSGCEMTPVWSITSYGERRSGSDPRVQPKVVIYDPELTLDLPPSFSAISGLGALASCIQALCAENADPATLMMAEEGIRLIAGNLPRVVAAPGDRGPREKVLCGAWFAGSTLGVAEDSLHNWLCDRLRAAFGLPAAQVHAAILAHVVAYRAGFAPSATDRVAKALGVDDPAAKLYDLAAAIGAPTGLKGLGVREKDFEELADVVARSREFREYAGTGEQARVLLRSIHRGHRPILRLSKMRLVDSRYPAPGAQERRSMTSKRL